MAAADRPFDEVVAAVEEAVAILHPGRGLVETLEAGGRASLAARLAARDETAAWELVTELNELRGLA